MNILKSVIMIENPQHSWFLNKLVCYSENWNQLFRDTTLTSMIIVRIGQQSKPISVYSFILECLKFHFTALLEDICATLNLQIKQIPVIQM